MDRQKKTRKTIIIKKWHRLVRFYIKAKSSSSFQQWLRFLAYLGNVFVQILARIIIEKIFK